MAQTTALILLAEDDAAQREVLVEILELEGYRVLTASGPSEVLEGLLRSPELVLMDLVGVASPAVMRALRALPRRPVLLLVSGDTQLAGAAERLGADGFLGKPYGVDELLARVREALLSGPRQWPADSACAGA